MKVVLCSSYLDRLHGIQGIGESSKFASKEECAEVLDKRMSPTETWPGIGALVHGLEDEYPQVRLASLDAIGKIAENHYSLREQVSLMWSWVFLFDRD